MYGEKTFNTENARWRRLATGASRALSGGGVGGLLVQLELSLPTRYVEILIILLQF